MSQIPAFLNPIFYSIQGKLDDFQDTVDELSGMVHECKDKIHVYEKDRVILQDIFCENDISGSDALDARIKHEVDKQLDVLIDDWSKKLQDEIKALHTHICEHLVIKNNQMGECVAVGIKKARKDLKISVEKILEHTKEYLLEIFNLMILKVGCDAAVHCDSRR
ncbi:uncharacterized protein MELLADRAFT_103735 [Melampsora larici-populina 98AG31]|uniref:Uncharacterized protein n=1 Tax=Melampsora larici-populina (strain 98AG31 / pathotype 3-4-7) TaxID=747676 RepID=F4RC74_MELLP|nr:uncharacterized protein MELLADRAFT_103735 [Melampsora larici-populina 98AG31]EGG09687.1 hypothetical protein MELLADRAFT_103735 [Melampsora larici-populina 98AG31]